MKATREYMQYAPIRRYIREEHLERDVALAEAIANFVVNFWNLVRPRDEEIKLPTTRLAAE